MKILRKRQFLERYRSEKYEKNILNKNKVDNRVQHPRITLVVASKQFISISTNILYT